MGKLVIYTGPMKSGKTTKLIEKYKEELSLNKSCYFFKPTIDTRFSSDYVMSRDGLSVPAHNIKKIDELERYSFLCDIFFIDEFQFLGGHIDVILDLLDKNKTIYIAGLNLTSDRTQFGLMGYIMPYADEIIISRGNCDHCGAEDKGVYTFCDVEKTGDILVGEQEYKCVCPKCYKQLTKKCVV